MEVADVATRRLAWIRRRHDDVGAAVARALLRPADRGDLGVGKGDAWHGAVIGSRVLTLQAPGHDLTVVVGEVGEPADAGDIAGTVDPVARLERLRIDLQPSPFRLGQPDRLPRLEVGSAAGRHEQPVARHRRARLEVQHDIRPLLFHRHRAVADQDLDPVLFQVGQQSSACLGLLQGQESRSGLDDGHLRAEPGKALGQLDADRTAAEDDQPRRQLARDRGLAIGPVVDLVQTLDGRDRRGAAVGDDDCLARHQLLAADLHRAQVDQAAGAAKKPGPGGLKRRRGS